MLVISDFDTTLKFPFSKQANEETVCVLKEFQQQDARIWIVTSRHWSITSHQEIRDFLCEHGIEVKQVVHTEGRLKALHHLVPEADVFIDDDETERTTFAKMFPNTRIINPIEHLSEDEINWFCFGE